MKGALFPHRFSARGRRTARTGGRSAAWRRPLRLLGLTMLAALALAARGETLPGVHDGLGGTAKRTAGVDGWRQAHASVEAPGSALPAPGGRSSAAPLASGYPLISAAQADEIRALLASFKRDPRGPYLDIRWFCNDGTVLPPQAGACGAHGGGHQHAELKPQALALETLGFHPGTILRAIAYERFVDAEHANYRLRELIVDSFLQQYDDGWVLRRARYYRGARQIEDEERQGRQFLQRLLADPAWRADNPLLAVQLVAAVPHGQAGVPGNRIRSLAARIAELDPRFMDLRVKIHSRPGAGDLQAVAHYRDALPASSVPELRVAVDELYQALASVYADRDYAQR
ncbi:MAG: hypothetical protein ACE5HV_12640, partial [Acidobacteriota bacterium]